MIFSRGYKEATCLINKPKSQIYKSTTI